MNFFKFEGKKKAPQEMTDEQYADLLNRLNDIEDELKELNAVERDQVPLWFSSEEEEEFDRAYTERKAAEAKKIKDPKRTALEAERISIKKKLEERK